jgi:glycosyltransferase involved in cell wall biosynthesis
MLKGYQGWAGRALFGLVALRKLGSLLKGYTIIIYSNPDADDIKIASDLLAQELGIIINILPKTNHNEILYWQSQSRISIGLSISDGISTALLEAMALGSFPIQSDSSAANEWIEDKKTGILVSAEDPLNIADSIKRALLDDQLVDDANDINWNVISQRAEFNHLKNLSLRSYKQIINKIN